MMQLVPTDEPLLPLDTFRAQLGLNPWHFWQLADARIVPVESKCSTLVFEHDWQGSDAAGRASVRDAILRAEEKLSTYLGYRPAPAYVQDTLPWPRFGQADHIRFQNLDATGRRVALMLREGMVQALGTEQRTLIGTATVAGDSLVYSDQLGTGFDDTFIITLPIPLGMTLTTDQVAVYFAAGDRLDGANVGERWRVQPVKVSISGGNVVIVGRRWLVVKPLLYEAPRQQALDPTQAANFVTSLEVYQRTTYQDGTTAATSQAALIYESRACPCGWGAWFPNTAPASTDPAAAAQIPARTGIRDADLGLITPASAIYDPTAGTWSDTTGYGCWYEPDRVAVRYLAGVPLEGGQMARRWQQVVVELAAAELKRRICACRETNERLHDLQQDLTLQTTQTERYQTAPEDLSNPFGTRRGHIRAWRAVKDLILRRGIAG